MSNTSINTEMLRNMFLCGAENLASNKEWINELNVFPVPDGDTGTNMTMTVVSAVKEVEALGDSYDMKTVCKAISSGSLRGARGNSGVILSQLFRGFCKITRDHSEADVKLIAEACEKAVETAYKAVMKPKEGTILTVAKGAAEKARELADSGMEDFDEFIPAVIAYAEEVLSKTPDMLPVLKQAGVVDSGGQGLVQVLKGAYEGYQGKKAEIEHILHPESAPAAESAEEETEEEIRYLYGTQFIVSIDKKYNSKTEADLLNYLESICEDIKINEKEGKLYVSVKTNDPGLVIQRGLLYGQLTEVEVVNVKLHSDYVGSLYVEENETPVEEPVEEIPAEPAERKDIGIIAVAAGDGIADIFKELGADYVISGGQTMNPSTEDILNAVARVNADSVIILPNNKNIILAANQAAAIETEKNIVVIPTKTIPQGITAVINFMPDQDAEANREAMTEEIANVKSAEITYAVRDTVIDDVEIHEGNMMAIGDSGILNVGTDLKETAVEAMSKMIGEETELISIYYGADVTEEDAEALREAAAEQFDSCEVELQRGGQPVYYYIISAE